MESKCVLEKSSYHTAFESLDTKRRDSDSSDAFGTRGLSRVSGCVIQERLSIHRVAPDQSVEPRSIGCQQIHLLRPITNIIGSNRCSHVPISRASASMTGHGARRYAASKRDKRFYGVFRQVGLNNGTLSGCISMSSRRFHLGSRFGPLASGGPVYLIQRIATMVPISASRARTTINPSPISITLPEKRRQYDRIKVPF